MENTYELKTPSWDRNGFVLETIKSSTCKITVSGCIVFYDSFGEVISAYSSKEWIEVHIRK